MGPDTTGKADSQPATMGPHWRYQSFRQFRKDLITPGTINSAMTAVLYDNENWSQTFANEQTNPAAYTALFANLAHAYGYAFVSAPATDPVTVQTSRLRSIPVRRSIRNICQWAFQPSA
jgi:hypothetical protein